MRRLWAQGAQGYLLLALILCSVSVGRAQASLNVQVLNNPIALYPSFLDIYGMNESGQIVGTLYNYNESVAHGFLVSGGNPIPINAPGSSYTSVSGINSSGQIAGIFYDAVGEHGFLYSGGIFTTIDVPGTSSGTVVNVINASGQLAGYFSGADGEDHGFLYSGGTFTTFDAPGAFYSTSVDAINDSGQMAGNFLDAVAGGTNHGFLLSGGSFTTIDVGGIQGSTYVSGINASGQVVGGFQDAAFKDHGFLLSGGSAGIYKTIDPPGSLATTVTGINASGQIAGNFIDAAHKKHGFLLSGGTYATIDAPGVSSIGTAVQGINDSGQVVGIFDDAAGNTRAFLASSIVTLLDPVPNLLNGPAVTTDSGLLSAPFIARQVSGVSADGATQIVVKIAAPAAGEQYTLTLLNDGNAQSNLPDEDGALGVLGTSTFVQSQILVTAEGTVNGPMAFAIYRAPVDFARLLNTNDESASQRSVSIQVVDNTTATPTTTKAQIQIVRPPVALIHGLWSDPSTWNEFANSLNSSKLFSVYRVNYQESNFIPVEINERISLTQLMDFLDQFKRTQAVAAVQFDLVGHSMGGLISRDMVHDSRFSIDGNYQKGWIHKLITIDTPHAGSIVPALLDKSGPICHQIFFDAGMAIDGATNDLEPGSFLLRALYSLPLPPTHAIAGHMTITQELAASLVVNNALALTSGGPVYACPTLFLAVVPFSFGGLYGDFNDVAVAVSSQVYEFPPGASEVVPGVVHLHVAPFPWLVQWAGVPPGALDAASDNPARVLSLLNTPPSSSAFVQGLQPQ
jgi:probable HAF family extracellular repeat protein